MEMGGSGSLKYQFGEKHKQTNSRMMALTLTYLLAIYRMPNSGVAFNLLIINTGQSFQSRAVEHPTIIS